MLNRVFWYLLASCLFGGYANAQTNTSSPYSIYGIGDLEPKSFSQNQAMGGVQIGYISSRHVNVLNPASYSTLAQPTFEGGVMTYFQTLSTITTTQTATDAYLKNLAFGFPINKRIGIAFGLVPYSKMGYKISSSDSVDGFGEVNYNYEGEGGVNQVFLGGSYSLLKDTLQQLAIGVNGSYLFGFLQKTREVLPSSTTSAFNTRNISQVNLGDFHVDAGLFYKRKIGKARIAVGLVYNIENRLNATLSNVAYTYEGDSAFVTVKDTILNTETEGTVLLPQSIGAGASVTLGGKWAIGFDWSMQDWSQYTFFDQPQGLARSQRYAFGLQHVPDPVAPSGQYMKRVNYRAGFRLENTRLVVQGQNVDEFGINIGVGFPLRASGSNSMLNVAVEYGQRGDNTNGLIKEQFVNLNIGFTFTPHKFDRWFFKRKID